jgi:hypothetical protein
MGEKVAVSEKRTGYIHDARGRRVTQLDPVAMNLLRGHTLIAADTLRKMAEEIDPGEVRKRRMGLVMGVVFALVAYILLFFYFRFFAKGSWRDPVMMVFYASYLVFPSVFVYLKFRKARTARNERIHLIMLKYRHCPHCGYDIRGLPVNPDAGATVCPECGCAWMLDDPQSAGSADDG